MRFGKHQKAADILEKAKQELEALGYKPDMSVSTHGVVEKNEAQSQFRGSLTVFKTEPFNPDIALNAQ